MKNRMEKQQVERQEGRSRDPGLKLDLRDRDTGCSCREPRVGSQCTLFMSSSHAVSWPHWTKSTHRLIHVHAGRRSHASEEVKRGLSCGGTHEPHKSMSPFPGPQAYSRALSSA